MTYIILAAGKGNNLQPLTLKYAKTSYKLDEETTVLQRMVRSIRKSDRNAEIVVVIGYKANNVRAELDGENVRFVMNPFGAYNIVARDSQVLVMSKKLENFTAKYCCMTKLDPVSSRLLKEEVDSMINGNMYDQYFEDSLVQMIMFHDFQLFYEDIAGKEWAEVDTVDDLLTAQDIHRRSAQ